MHFEIYQVLGQWRWRLRAANHEIVASGEGYVNRAGAEHAISLLKDTNALTPTKYV
jgi:uncharacterized protein YegP (UPF0339 family)